MEEHDEPAPITAEEPPAWQAPAWLAPPTPPPSPSPPPAVSLRAAAKAHEVPSRSTILIGLLRGDPRLDGETGLQRLRRRGPARANVEE